MNMRRLRHIVAFVTLICVLTTGSLEGRTTTELFSNDASWTLVSPEIDAYMAKWLWVNCKVDLIDMKRTVEGLDLCHSDEMPICSIASSSERQPLIRKNLHKVISIFPPQLKRALVDCLRKQNIMFHVSGEEDGYNIWFAEYLEYLFRWPDPPRRHLVDAFSGISVTPAPSPGVLPPTYGPAPSADPAAPSSEAPGPAPRAEVPSPPRAEAPPPFFPRTLDSTPQPPANVHTSVSPDVAAPPSSKKDGRKRVVVAVVVTAGTTFFIAALLFCCYRKYRKNSSPGDGFKDESPLLSISLSDFSGGSSRKGNSIGREKFGTPSFSTSSHNGRPSSLESNFSIELDVDKASVTGASLSVATLGSKPSTDSPAVPDTISASVSPLPPLKPPPGRGGPPPRPPPPGPPPPPIPSGIKPGPRPPPPPMGGAPPRPPQPFSMKPKVTQPSPLGQNHLGSTSAGAESEADAPKTKLKPFFWDKVLANPDQSMVWHQIKSGSFQFNEEMIETLFGYNNADKNRVQRKTESLAQDPSAQYIQIIDSKKAQNLSILLRALNLTTEEVCGALYEGTELPMELCQTLLKMAPTAEEELKLRLYNDDLSQLGPAERFLKVLVNIPFAFKRLDSLCFMTFYQEEVSSIKESLATLEVACKELRNSRLFLKLLEAVLKTGNRMNDGTFRGGAQAFKLDTLLKLADVKGTDGKTTLLQFVVQEIIRSEGVRAARAARENQSLSSVKSDDLFDDSLNEPEEHYRSLGLQVVSRLGVELENVKKASVLDADGLSGTVAKLGHALSKSRDFLNTEMKSLDEDRGFHHTLESFVQNAEVDITWLLEEEKRIMALVKNTADYFHGNAKKDEGLRLFVIVRSFLVILDKTCKEVKESAMRPTRTPRKKESPSVPPSQDVHRRLFPAIVDRRVDNSSSDDEDS